MLTQSGFMRALGRARQAKGRQYYDADVNMPAFLTAKNLKPFVSDDLAVTSSQLAFRRGCGLSASPRAAWAVRKAISFASGRSLSASRSRGMTAIY